jgi:hypothetical protein
MLQDACLLCDVVNQIRLKIALRTRPPSTGHVYSPLSLLSLLAMLQDACLVCDVVKLARLKIALRTRPPSMGGLYLPVSLLSLLAMLQHASFSCVGARASTKGTKKVF